MSLLPRSIRIRQPYRGRTFREYADRLPLIRRIRLSREERVRRCIATNGRRALESGAREGRRFLTALPHPFCGIGHASSEWNTAYQWAPLLGLEYVNTPLQEPWASFLGFGAKAPDYWGLCRRERPIVVRLPLADWSPTKDPLAELRPVVASIRSSRNLLFVLADRQNCFDHTANAAQLRQDFQEHGKWRHLPDHREAGRLNVAVHVRRGDVAAMKARGESNWRERFVEPDWFAHVIERVRREAGEQRPLFHLYSQGSPEEFSSITRAGDVRLHLDVNEQETLLNMSRADTLIMSPSGFSYLAALLGSGRRIARTPWWHHLPEGGGWTLLPSR